MEGNTLLVRIMDEMVDALGVESRRPAFYAVNRIPFRQEKFGEICAVLSSRTGDEGHLPGCSHYCTPWHVVVRSTRHSAVRMPLCGGPDLQAFDAASANAPFILHALRNAAKAQTNRTAKPPRRAGSQWRE